MAKRAIVISVECKVALQTQTSPVNNLDIPDARISKNREAEAQALEIRMRAQCRIGDLTLVMEKMEPAEKANFTRPGVSPNVGLTKQSQLKQACRNVESPTSGLSKSNLSKKKGL